MNLDPTTVFGLFTYGGPSGSNEIDIEAALWGQTDPNATNLAYTIYPADVKDASKNISSEIRVPSTAQGTYSTHRFEWSKERVSLKSFYGHTDDPNNSNVIYSWTTPDTFTPLMPVAPAPIIMNLWSFEKQPPANQQPVEFIIHEFKYTPAQSKRKRVQYYKRKTNQRHSKLQQYRQSKRKFLDQLSFVSK
jgi:hypothetical protein